MNIIIYIIMKVDIGEFIKQYDAGNRTMEFNIDVIYQICAHKRFDILQWMYEIDNTILDERLFSFVLGIDLQIGKWIHSELTAKGIKIDLDKFKNLFNGCCENCNVEVLEWIYNTIPVNQQTKKKMLDDGFRTACFFGNTFIADWLYQKGADIRNYRDYGFRRSCEHNCIDCSQWLCSVYNGYSITIKDNKIIGYTIDSVQHDPDKGCF